MLISEIQSRSYFVFVILDCYYLLLLTQIYKYVIDFKYEKFDSSGDKAVEGEAGPEGQIEREK